MPRMVELVVDLRFKQSSELQGAYGDMHSRNTGRMTFANQSTRFKSEFQ